MKRSTKIWLTVAGCLVAAGILITTIGVWSGGYYRVREWVESGELSWNFGWYWRGFTRKHMVFDSNYPVYEGDVDKTRVPEAENPDRMFLDIGGGVVEFKTSDDGNYYFSGENAIKFQCYVKGDALYVIMDYTMNVINQNHMVTVWIPENQTYREISFDVGSGDIHAQGLNADNIKFDVGSGEIRTQGLKADDISFDVGSGEILVQEMNANDISLDVGSGEIRTQALNADDIRIDVGSGAVTISQMETRNLIVDIGSGQVTMEDSTVKDSADLDVGVGQVNYTGSIMGNLDADCSVGAMYFKLSGAKEDHNYEVECSMGSVTVGSESFGGMAASRSIQYGAASNFDLDCSIGEISITFH